MGVAENNATGGDKKHPAHQGDQDGGGLSRAHCAPEYSNAGDEGQRKPQNMPEKRLTAGAEAEERRRPGHGPGGAADLGHVAYPEGRQGRQQGIGPGQGAEARSQP